MRMLFVALTLSANVATANGTVHNTEPEPSPIKIQPTASARLAEIDSELRSLERRPPASEIFGHSMTTMTPLLGVSAIPLVAVGFVFGVTKAGGSGNDFVAVLAAGAAAILAVASLACVIVAGLAVFDHWAQDAATASDRQARARVLRTERQELASRL